MLEKNMEDEVDDKTEPLVVHDDDFVEKLATNNANFHIKRYDDQTF